VHCFHHGPTCGIGIMFARVIFHYQKLKKPFQSFNFCNGIALERWATRFCWSKLICGKDGKMHMVKCRVCSKVEGRDKLLVPKLDFFIKHSRMWKCTIVKPRVAIGQCYICPTNSHVKNEKLFVAKGLDTVVVQLENGGKAERKKSTSNLWKISLVNLI
jgi:hypothetical protein